MKKTVAVSIASAVSGIALLTLGLLNGDQTQIEAGAASLGMMGIFLTLGIRILLQKVKLLEEEKTEASKVVDINTAVDYANKRDGQ